MTEYVPYVLSWNSQYNHLCSREILNKIIAGDLNNFTALTLKLMCPQTFHILNGAWNTNFTCISMEPEAFFSKLTAWVWVIPSVDVPQIVTILSPTCKGEKEIAPNKAAMECGP